MKKMHHIVWLHCIMAVAISVSLAFNIDTTTPHVYTTDQKDFFRNKVLQIISGRNEGILTGPQQLQGSEETCKSDTNQTHQCLIIPDISLTDTTIPINHFGLSIAEDSRRSQFTVCSPSVIHDCYENSSQSKVCYNMPDNLQQISSFTPDFQECIQKTVDLVFLFDGSASMTESEFNKNKDFIVDIMNSFLNTSIKFAAVQFSFGYRKVFDFNDYQAGSALNKLMEEGHMKSLTDTHKALKFVLEEILEKPDAGASPDATKVVVLITDGDPSDIDKYGIIKKYDDKNIIRFVIGVKDANLDKFRAFASEPKDKYAFKIKNYDGLTGILENLQKKICKMEGPEVAQAGDIGSSVLYKICSPSVAHECNENSYVNSVCYKMTDDLKQISSFTPVLQECIQKTVDLVFLFDGSASMTESEFNKNKDFIEDIMKSLLNTSIKFAAVQFSSDYRKVFDFNDYQAGSALDKLMEEEHLRSLTNTHRALTFVLEEILENPDAGSPDATKVVVLITDGDPSDSDKYGIIQKYDDKNIIRFVIAIKDANPDICWAFASEPKDKYALKIQNYDGLTGILENFKKKILQIRDSTVARAENITNEMSRSAFSAVFYKDTLILGSVLSNSWHGSSELHELKQTQIEDPNVKNDSYLGFSISVGEKNKAPIYFTGAPRFEHTGQVVLFRHDCKNWTAAQRVNGDQIGSYFGAELCSVDVNSDGNTDFLLVGAPLFYQPQEKREGRIYVYTLTDEIQLKRELNVTAPSMGRFGTTISSLADLNGDGLRDVAVGAPLEDDNGGAVYIYLGDRQRGIHSTFSQRILGQKIKPGLRFFGQAIDGDIDLGEDGLPNIVIGSQGTAVVLRSRPVVDVIVHLSLHPEKINTKEIDCLGNTDDNLPSVTLRACFEMVEITKSKAGAISSGLNISYILDVDPMRQTHRGFFSQTDEKARNLTSTYELRDKNTCFPYTIYMLKCVDDTLSPISIRLNFFQIDSESASVVLNVDSIRQTVVEVQYVQ
ncbi:integrin alpha-L-like isoform X7 [Dicentrarchus labrax]|uniref:integrin alpha-L-like isoform X2 n=1 Tax=Dicentrarchus labrax TaxID=13489 RepID=UPI0021F5607C|nr:integrin alpha-L-like isoform X2 [Dicentrarchus labrax]XP_051241530.1 integrin alpha-L-like isoform X3 [Dicentrarchus labrax]XP_051241531.1 integrin alpha-L-like isoform X4 [Dicentrarchus labrax]XP_051241532.1 integrin alpha-L-like isoform X5 [Dicentrarchus labrax]XP_051241533.1 integrin alpha-L-like isoform X6 [Dicentrarchus labrax]XP_051241534.1 integrin alpha-L-like isoform X7 [Dicentrarchus labrax]